MARYSAGGRSTGIGSNLLPVWAIVPSANVEVELVELAVYNTSSTPVVVALQRFTTAGTAGGAVISIPHNPDSLAASTTVKNTYTVGPTLTSGYLYQATLGAAVGSAMVWTFGGQGGLIIPKGTANGIGIMVPTGAGQVLDFYVVYEE